jgi:tetrathionate reductase subunit B
MKVFTIDIAKCVGCYNCQVACKDEHCGNDWMPYARPQPDAGQFWMKVNYEEKGTIPKVRVVYQPVMCMHCRNAPCMASCPVAGAIYRRDDGLVIIDPKRCSGCRNCIHGCPYKVIYYNEDSHLAQKCTGCAHLLDRGWKEPRCVDACPTDALRYVDETELKKYHRVEVLHPEFNTSPIVYYLNIPRKFVAGTLYDPVIKRVIVGAVCTLNGENGTVTVTTDGFGDIWFENLKTDIYTLKIVYNGREKIIDKINTKKDINLGDIPF